MFYSGARQLSSKLLKQGYLVERLIDNVLSINNPAFDNYLGQRYSVELRIKITTMNFCFFTQIYYCGFEGMVNFTFPFMTNEMIAVTTSQTLLHKLSVPE